MALALISIGLLIIGVVVVLSFVWSRPVQPIVEPSGPAEDPDERGQPWEPGPAADEWSKPERPRRQSLFGLGVLLALVPLATPLVALFTAIAACGIGPGAGCSKVENLAINAQVFGMPGFAVVGLLGAWLGGYRARPVWLGVGLVGQALSAFTAIAIAAA